MATIKIFRFVGGQKAATVATVESLFDAKLLIGHLILGHHIITRHDNVSDEELNSSSVGHYEAFRQKDLYNFDIGKAEDLNPVYTSPYYYTTQYD